MHSCWRSPQRLVAPYRFAVRTTIASTGRSHANFLIARRSSDPIRYSLKRKNYDHLILTDVLAPRILVVVIVPQEIEEWIALSEEQLVLRRCGYWVSLAGQPQSDNETSVTVSVPRASVLTTDALQGLMHALKPLEVAAYLRAKGWRHEADLAGKGSLWLLHSMDGTEFDVTVPARRGTSLMCCGISRLLQRI
jgi:Domain of unknown function (DUF4365)